MFSRGNRWRKNRRGFTMVEMLVALAMSSIVLIAIGKAFSISNRSYLTQDQVAYTEQNLRAALEIMAFELRIAGYIPLGNLQDGDDEITTDVSGKSWSDGVLDRLEYATANAIALTADLNPDDNPATTEYAETVYYSVSGTTLNRQSWQWDPGSSAWVADTTDPVMMAQNITNLTFSYTFADGTRGIPIAGDPDYDRDDVRAVTITLTGETSRSVQATEKGQGKVIERTLQSIVMMRNMELDPTVAQMF